MIYLDSSLFLNGALFVDERGERARKLLSEVQSGKKQAATSALTYDEVFWVIKKHRGFKAALEAAKALLEMPNLTLLPVETEVLWVAYGLSERYELNPRDAIHVACALANGIRVVVSSDPDFDRVKEIERREA
ncbi:MAG: type II toxin-antitoxin system VapC family toxin [Candidatus Bathyarchaeia archaeon]|nr:type II toxin-antitoxin system VapC family toxin [Candidatus Bathyarchaeota archaeon]